MLADIVIPADERSGSATDALAPEFIDFILDDPLAEPRDRERLQTRMRGGLAWLERECARRCGKGFAAASADERKALLDDIAWPDKARPEMEAGAAFFTLFRDLVASGFWSSKIGRRGPALHGQHVRRRVEGLPRRRCWRRRAWTGSCEHAEPRARGDPRGARRARGPRAVRPAHERGAASALRRYTATVPGSSVTLRDGAGAGRGRRRRLLDRPARGDLGRVRRLPRRPAGESAASRRAAARRRRDHAADAALRGRDASASASRACPRCRSRTTRRRSTRAGSLGARASRTGCRRRRSGSGPAGRAATARRRGRPGLGQGQRGRAARTRSARAPRTRSGSSTSSATSPSGSTAARLALYPQVAKGGSWVDAASAAGCAARRVSDAVVERARSAGPAEHLVADRRDVRGLPGGPVVRREVKGGAA